MGEHTHLRFFAVLLLVLLVAAGVGAWLLYSPVGPAPGTPDAQAIFVDVAPGSGTRAIAAQLKRAGVIRSQYAFVLMRTIQGGTLKAGEYRFNRPADVSEVYARLERGDVFTIPVSVPEGFNIFDIANAVANAGLAGRDTFLQAEQKRTDLIADLSPHASSLEGFLYPDTYRFPRTATPETMLTAMVRRFRQAAAQLALTAQPAQSPQPGRSAEPGRSIAQIVTLASLIEKEVAVGSERPLVAGVFENRLQRGMPLATDPTVIYAAELAGRWRGTIYASDLQFDSPYNTYKHAGLPPGPICNPGAAALTAALEPAHTDYLYFVADAQGHSRFAATLDQHARNVRQYRSAIGEVKPPPPPASRPARKKHRR